MWNRSVVLWVTTILALAGGGAVPLAASAVGPTVTGVVGGSCRGVAGTIFGTNASETIDGTSGDDVIVAGSGHDIVHARGGNDRVCGNRGGDQLFGEDGDDRIFGQRGGRDERPGGTAFYRGNLLDGGTGNDVLSGGPERDKGADFPGGEIPDRVSFGSATGGVTVQNGHASGPGVGADTLRQDFEQINGTGFDDTLRAFARETLLGFGGDDVLVAHDTGARSVVLGGNGNDRIDLSAAAQGRATGGSGKDQIIGSPRADLLFSGSGSDDVSAGRGPDQAFGLSLGDLVKLGPGSDFIEVSGSTRGGRIRAGLGVDTLRIVTKGPQSEIGIRTMKRVVRTASGRFSILDLNRYVVAGGVAGAGAFRFFGGPTPQAVLTLSGTFTHLEVHTGGGADTVSLTASTQSVGALVTGGDGNDKITGTRRGDALRGNDGRDRTDGRRGRDLCRAETRLNCER
ncbi:MAG: calcium-binding protein [Nocardioidaceae bacterium]